MKTDFDVKAGIQAVVDYLRKDESLKKGDYYSEGMDSSETKATTAVWAGSLSSSVGLKGVADEEMFSRLQSGYLPNGQRMRFSNQTGEEILLHDMTLSAPKSYTLHAMEDLRLFDAHMRVCEETIKAAEKRYCLYQTGQDRHREHGQGFIAAVIPHWTNRKMEPQLHSHCAIFNGTKTQEGTWQGAWFVDLSREKWLGSYYRNLLAQEAQKLGYKIVETPMEGGAYGFEIEGLSRSQIEEFSKRTKEIEKAKVEKGWEGNEATLKTRKKKEKEQPSWSELKAQTLEQLEAMGATLQAPSDDPVEVTGKSAREIVDAAVRHLSQRSTRFKDVDIHNFAFNHMEGFSVDELEYEIATTPNLLDYSVIKGNPKLKGVLTTVEALEREAQTVEAWLQGQGAVQPISERLDAHKKLNELYAQGFRPLNKGQYDAVLGILTSSDRHLIFHGLSGVGKTTAMKPLMEIAEQSGIKIKWFAPSLDAADKLQEETGRPATTLQRLVYTEYAIHKGEVLIVDESGLSSADMAEVLLQKANAVGARIILVGDTGQNQPIDAGSPMQSLIDHGATTFDVEEIIRQKNKDQKKAVELASKGKADEALQLLNDKGYVSEIEKISDRTQSICQAYLDLTPEERADTLIVAGTHAEKDAIAGSIRIGLKAEGVLGESFTGTQLRDYGWTIEQVKEIRNYKVGDYVSQGKALKTSPLVKDDFYQITDIKDDHLIVQSVTGKSYEINPAQYSATANLRVYSAKAFDIAVGDELRWQHTNHKRYRKNGDTFKVTAIEGAIATIEQKGKVRKLNLNDPIAADYTLISTNYRAQGSDRKRVFVSATPDPTSNKEPFYVAISRQVKYLKIWTSNLEALERRVVESSAQINPLKDIGVSHAEDIRTNRNPIIGRLRGDGPNRDLGYTEAFGRAASPNEDKRDRNREHLSHSFGWHRGTVEKAKRRGEQDFRRDWESGDNNRQYQGSGGRLHTAIRPPERDVVGDSQFTAENTGNPSPDSRDFTTADRILESVYKQKLSEALHKPLQDLTQSLIALDSAKAKNAELQIEVKRQQMFAQVQAKAVATALNEWRLKPVAKAEVMVHEALAFVSDRLPKPKPKPDEEPIFWQPIFKENPGGFIEDHHWAEFRKSAIHPEFPLLNAKSLSGDAVIERLLSHKLETMGAGQFITTPQAKLIAHFEHVAKGGWYAKAGVDPQDMSREKDWGVFKPDTPRFDKKKDKQIKYEHPLGVPRGIYLPHVPENIATAIYKKHGISPTEEELKQGFWPIVHKYNLTIVFTEGVKKTWASLSQGYPTIGVSGVNGLYFAKKDGDKLPERILNPDIAVFATPGRNFVFAFDQDDRPKTVENVRRDMVRAIELLSDRGCNSLVAEWGTDTKGLDDLIYLKGPRQYSNAIANAAPPDSVMQAHYEHSYNKLLNEVQLNYPGESQAFYDAEIWVRAVQRGDLRDGERFVGAVTDPAYVEYILKEGGNLRRAVIAPDPVIMSAVASLKTRATTDNGVARFDGKVYRFHWVGNTLNVRKVIHNNIAKLVYQVRDGRVTHKSEVDELRDRCQMMQAQIREKPKKSAKF